MQDEDLPVEERAAGDGARTAGSAHGRPMSAVDRSARARSAGRRPSAGQSLSGLVRGLLHRLRTWLDSAWNDHPNGSSGPGAVRQTADVVGPRRSTPGTSTIAPAETSSRAIGAAANERRSPIEPTEARVAESEMARTVEPWAIPDAELRSPRPEICPFLRAEAAGALGVPLGVPLEFPDVRNRCAAFGEPIPQSRRQQELVCLHVAHANCPRYLRGALVSRETLSRASTGRPLPRATLGATAILGISTIVAVAFVVTNGGLRVPAAAVTSLSPSGVAQVAPAASVGGPSPAISATSRPTASASAGATPVPSPTQAPTPSPAPTPVPAKSPAASPTSNRYQVLTACQDRPACYIYTVRSGDNLFSIAHWFGIPLDTVYSLNPWLRTTGLRPGQRITLPPPTR